MASSTLSASPSLAVHFATTTNAISLCSFLSDRVPQNANALYLKLDDVSLAQVAVRLDACAAFGSPRTEDLTGVDRLRLGDVGDHVRELVVHVGRIVLAPRLAVDADTHRQVTHVHLIGCEYAGDRKSTRLNSSHANISYAVFCLKKKKIN